MNKKTSLVLIFSVFAFFVITELSAAPKKTTKYITIDQFGYLPDAPKIAVIRDPQTGNDAAESFNPDTNYELRRWHDDAIVYTSGITPWNNGAEDPSSGDKAWWFDFSSVKVEGNYYVYDKKNDVGSYMFSIGTDIYNEVLKHAIRTFYYQRSGTPKLSTHAGEGWADAAAFVAPLQDKNCRLYSDKDNASTEKDLSGGWFDAGDYNKYTSFLWDVIPELLSAYEQNPKVFKDNYNIPESGNGIPDLLDEVKWGLNWLLKMQNKDGSVLSLVGVGVTEQIPGGFKNSSASPPSATKGQSLYGPATTDGTYISSAIFAHAAIVFKSLNKPAQNNYADSLKNAAIKAWEWANFNPKVIWRNNDANYNSKGLAAGGTDKSGSVQTYRTGAACYLYALTNDKNYKEEFEKNYKNINMIKWSYVYKYESPTQDMMLYYTKLPGISPIVRDDIRNIYKNSMVSNKDNLPSISEKKDPYLAYMSDYVWGSNSFLCRQGTMYFNMKEFGLDSSSNINYKNIANTYINKMHGINPMGLVYLTNMKEYGAENSCNQIWHSWFKNGSAKWDEVGVSQYGPPPGFIPGGPMNYKKDPCCDDRTCGGTNNDICNSETNLPINQPKQKGFKDTNTNWPLNTWTITENAIYYQAAYIKLLSKFASGNDAKVITQTEETVEAHTPIIFPNPGFEKVSVSFNKNISKIELIDNLGKIIFETKNTTFSLSGLNTGVYFVKIFSENNVFTKKLVKE